MFFEKIKPIRWPSKTTWGVFRYQTDELVKQNLSRTSEGEQVDLFKNSTYSKGLVNMLFNGIFDYEQEIK